MCRVLSDDVGGRILSHEYCQELGHDAVVWWLCRALGAGQDLKSFDVDNRWGLEALKRIMDDCTGQTAPIAGVEVSNQSSPQASENLPHQSRERRMMHPCS